VEESREWSKGGVKRRWRVGEGGWRREEVAWRV
jgi:hypothetical protein